MIYKATEFVTVSAAHTPDGTGLWDLSNKWGMEPLTIPCETINAQLTNYQYLSDEARKFGGTLAVEKSFDSEKGCVIYSTSYDPVSFDDTWV